MNADMVAREFPVERSCAPWPARGCCGSCVVAGTGAAGSGVPGGVTMASYEGLADDAPGDADDTDGVAEAELAVGVGPDAGADAGP